MVCVQALAKAQASPAACGAASTTMRNSSGRSIAMVSATGAPVAGMTKLTVTVATGSPADNRRVRAAEGGGRPISICTAPGRGPSVPAERQGSGNDSGDGTPGQLRCCWPGGLARPGVRDHPELGGDPLGQVAGGQRTGFSANRPHAPDGQHRLAGSDAERAADVLGRAAHGGVQLVQASCPPIGSTRETSPNTPSSGTQYSAGLARYTCPSGRRRTRCRATSSSMAASISAELTLYRLASAVSRGSRQPGS